MARRLRRGLAVVAITAAVLLGLAGPALAGFRATWTSPVVSFTTETVPPATGVTAVLNSCNNGRWMNVTVSWTASPEPRVSGYVVTMRRSDGSTATVGQTSASVTSLSTTVDKLTSSSVTFVVTAQLAGWTADSLPSGAITC